MTLGVLTNMMAADFGGITPPDLHGHGASLLQQLSLVVLSLVFLAAVFRRGARAFVSEGLRGHHSHA